MGRVAALVKYYMNGLIPFLEENRTNKKSNAPSPKTITSANKQKDYKLTKAATLLEISHWSRRLWTKVVFNYEALGLG